MESPNSIPPKPQSQSQSPSPSPSPHHQQLQLNIHKALSDLHSNFAGLVHNLPHFSLPNQNPSSLKTHLQNTLSTFHTQAKNALDSGISSLFPGSSSSSGKNPTWARVSPPNNARVSNFPRRGSGMSTEAIEERLAGVPVFALSNAEEEFVLVSGASTGKSLGLFCFKKEDAEALLNQIQSMDPGMRNGSKVVAVALNKVFQLKVDGVAFRLIPDYSQVKNALGERERSGSSDDSFNGVPVFQSRSLILKSQNKSYRPAFFRKEDLENSLLRASRQQNQLNPAFKPGDIQVAVLEDIIKGMKENSPSIWDDVVFIPPGFDVSTDPIQQ